MHPSLRSGSVAPAAGAPFAPAAAVVVPARPGSSRGCALRGAKFASRPPTAARTRCGAPAWALWASAGPRLHIGRFGPCRANGCAGCGGHGCAGCGGMARGPAFAGLPASLRAPSRPSVLWPALPRCAVPPPPTGEPFPRSRLRPALRSEAGALRPAGRRLTFTGVSGTPPACPSRPPVPGVPSKLQFR